MTTAARPHESVDGLRRSVRLLKAFRLEQTDPDQFYGLLADDSVRQVSGYAPVGDRIVLDVGSGPGYFAEAFREAGARYVSVDTDLTELGARFSPGPGTIIGDGMRLPVATAAVDVAFCSNLVEHVSQPWLLCDELVRVARPGGTVVISFTNWLSPWGGHETSPWHYLGGRRAAERYTRRYGHPPKNVYGETLFPVSVRAALRWARSRSDVEIVAAIPRYHPSWSHWVIRVPVLREFVTWNAFLVLHRL